MVPLPLYGDGFELAAVPPDDEEEPAAVCWVVVEGEWVDWEGEWVGDVGEREGWEGGPEAMVKDYFEGGRRK